MKNKAAFSVILPATAGLILYLLQMICFDLIFPMRLNDGAVTFLLFFSMLTGIILAIATILYKCTSILQSLLRWVTIVLSFAFWMLLNGYIGTVLRIQSVLGIVTGASTDNVSGMLTLTFCTFVFSACFIAVLVCCAIKYIKK